MPTRRSAMGWGVYNNYVIVAGGEYQDRQLFAAFRATEAYDATLNRWQVLPSMPHPRHGFTGGVIGNRFYAVSGDAQSAASGIEHSAIALQRCVGARPRAQIGRGGEFHANTLSAAYPRNGARDRRRACCSPSARTDLSRPSRSPLWCRSPPAPAWTRSRASTATSSAHTLGKPVVVDNRPGAAMMLAMTAVARCAARRLHARDRDLRSARDQSGALQEDRLRSRQGLRADRALREVAVRAGRQSGAAGAFGRRPHQARQGECDAPHLFDARRRPDAAPVGSNS